MSPLYVRFLFDTMKFMQRHLKKLMKDSVEFLNILITWHTLFVILIMILIELKEDKRIFFINNQDNVCLNTSY